MFFGIHFIAFESKGLITLGMRKQCRLAQSKSSLSTKLVYYTALFYNTGLSPQLQKTFFASSQKSQIEKICKISYFQNTGIKVNSVHVVVIIVFPVPCLLCTEL